jgi:hypothetical protein
MDRQGAETFPAPPLFRANFMPFRKAAPLPTSGLASAACPAGRPLVSGAVYFVSYVVVTALSLPGAAAPARLDRIVACRAPGLSA